LRGRIVQIVRHLAYGDGVCEVARGFVPVLASRGGVGSIFVETADPRLRAEARPLADVDWRPDDVAVLHVAGATGLGEFFARCPARKAIFFHNITPPELLLPGTRIYAECRRGWEELPFIAAHADLWLAVSAFNLEQLAARTGLDRPRWVVPPVIDVAKERARQPDPGRLHALRMSSRQNLLFVGRITPSKRQAELMEVFDHLHALAPTARLHLVGGATDNELYLLTLARLRARLPSGCAIEMPGKVTDAELVAYYRAADLFVCLSAHEGFCLPPLVAAAHDVPVLARASAAIPETLGPAAVLFDEHDPARIAALAVALLEDARVRSSLVAAARKHLCRFAPDEVGKAWDRALAAVRQ
jgi:glycosyltransferase involved in cell wall biosynthesis